VARRRKKISWRTQIAIVWFVIAGLLTFGLLNLRSNGKLTDRPFQPLALVLCQAGEELKTDYVWVSASSRWTDDGRRSYSGPSLKSVECVTAAGDRRSVRGFIPLLWTAVAIPLAAILYLGAWRRMARRSPKARG
jgi:hypothetical protein